MRKKIFEVVFSREAWVLRRQGWILRRRGGEPIASFATREEAVQRVVAWLGSERGIPPPPGPHSPHFDAVGHSEIGHRVEDLAGEPDLHPLASERSAPHPLTEDALVSEHGVLHQAPPAVTRTGVPLLPPELSHRPDVPVPLPLAPRTDRGWPGTPAWRDDHRHPAPASFFLNSFVHRGRIISPVSQKRGHPIVDLAQKTGNPRTVRRASIGQLSSKDLAGFGVYRQVEFPSDPPLRWLSKVADVNPETCAVDEQVDRSLGDRSSKPEVTELLQSPR